MGFVYHELAEYILFIYRLHTLLKINITLQGISDSLKDKFSLYGVLDGPKVFLL